MSLLSLRAAVLAGILPVMFGLTSECAHSVTIDFENLAIGTVLSNQ